MVDSLISTCFRLDDFTCLTIIPRNENTVGGMVNKGSDFADFVRFRPHTYNLHAHSTISAALMGGNYVYSHQMNNPRR